MARRLLTGWCAHRVDVATVVDAQLLASELVTNALCHGEGQITLRATLDLERLVVEVIDEGAGFEHQMRREKFGQMGGWGLDIVDEIASRWGINDGTTHVWFELERPGRGPDYKFARDNGKR